MNRRLPTILLAVLVLILVAWALNHVLFPTLPVPAGVPSITR